MTLSKLTLSFQKINMYSRCGLQYYFRYIEGLKIPPTTSVAIGSAFHKATESYYIYKKETKENPKVDLLLEKYSDEIENIFSEDLLLEKEEETKGKEKLKGEIKDAGTRALRVYYNQRALYLEPWLVEEQFIIKLDQVAKEFGFNDEEFKNIELLGYVDLVNIEGKVIDHKVKKASPSATEADKSQQLTIYALGYKEITGDLPERVVLENVILPLNKSSMGKIITLESMRTEKDLSRLLKRILRVVDGIKKEVYIPPDQGSWACNYCGYRKVGICKEYLI
ncbi:MAG: RecB family exonuclease [Dictyoglomus sp.]